MIIYNYVCTELTNHALKLRVSRIALNHNFASPFKSRQAHVTMNNIDGSDHYSKNSDGPIPSLLTIILDTNPNAWALLADTLPFSQVVANLLVFINAHLAFNHANKIAIIASHTLRAEFLYPTPTHRDATKDSKPDEPDNERETRDAESRDEQLTISDDANKYRPFRLIQETLVASLSHLLATTSATSLLAIPTTSIAGALTLALTYAGKQPLLMSSVAPTNNPVLSKEMVSPPLLSRILVFSVSGDLAHQYIPIMNSIFACQRLSIPIDVAKIAGDTVFLQQASDATRGTYVKLEHPQGLLQYLMMAFLPDQTSRRNLVNPTQVGVDFRAACFCHRDVVDVGFVCSICLSIFCSPPDGGNCLTCGTQLRLGKYGGKPAVHSKKKKKRKRTEA